MKGKGIATFCFHTAVYRDRRNNESMNGLWCSSYALYHVILEIDAHVLAVSSGVLEYDQVMFATVS